MANDKEARQDYTTWKRAVMGTRNIKTSFAYSVDCKISEKSTTKIRIERRANRLSEEQRWPARREG